MVYTETRDNEAKVDFKTAVMNGMNSATGGLYVPVEFPRVDISKMMKDGKVDFVSAAFEMAKPYVEGEIPDEDLLALIKDAYPFEPKLVKIDGQTYVLELSHGPTCAFKDFGARFMARAMSFFNKSENGKLHILVATSGDTGSAVGSAFHNVEGLDVTILYPEGKISPLQ
ncbi:MAG: threonine synthase, partial [Treponema sp.]|nr:threonine synthase [Treponema sp.]